MLEELAQALASADAAAVVETMAQDVTLRVAVHDAPFQGRAAATQILTAVLDGALHDIEVVETIEGRGPAVLMFTTGVAGNAGRAHGLLVIRPDGSGRISDLTVYLRPLAALMALAEEMGGRLVGPRPDGAA